jgi:hypothetical protein
MSIDGDVAMDWLSLGIGAVGPTFAIVGFLWRVQRKWDARGDAIDRIIASHQDVTWNLRVNGFAMERKNEPAEYQDRGLRDLVVEALQKLERNGRAIAELRAR